MPKKYSKKKSTKKRLLRTPAALITLIILLIIVLGAGGWAIKSHNDKSKSPSIPTNGNPNNPTKPYVNLSPPTSQDQQNNQANKQNLVDTGQSGTPTNADGKKAVTVVVTSATPTTINGYVSGVFEDGGTCTAKITNSSNGQVITLTSSGFQNASYTSCAPIHPSLSGNNWSMVLSYSSPTAEGNSTSTKIQ